MLVLKCDMEATIIIIISDLIIQFDNYCSWYQNVSTKEFIALEFYFENHLSNLLWFDFPFLKFRKFHMFTSLV